MFISKKKFNEAIAKAKEETSQEIWQSERLENLRRKMHDRTNELERRLGALESKGKKKRRYENVVLPNCHW